MAPNYRMFSCPVMSLRCPFIIVGILFLFDFMAQSAKSQADSAKEIAESSKTQADLALKTSSKADIKGWIAVIISILAFVWSIISHFI